MSSMMTQQFGVSARHLQILTVLWAAGKPILRSELLNRLRRAYGVEFEDGTLRSLLRRIDARGDFLTRENAPHRGRTGGRPNVLYSAKVEPEAVFAKLFKALCGEILADHPGLIQVALTELEKQAEDALRGTEV